MSISENRFSETYLRSIDLSAENTPSPYTYPLLYLNKPPVDKKLYGIQEYVDMPVLRLLTAGYLEWKYGKYPIIVAITGNIGSGKSPLASQAIRYFEKKMFEDGYSIPEIKQRLIYNPIEDAQEIAKKLKLINHRRGEYTQEDYIAANRLWSRSIAWCLQPSSLEHQVQENSGDSDIPKIIIVDCADSALRGNLALDDLSKRRGIFSPNSRGIQTSGFTKVFTGLSYSVKFITLTADEGVFNKSLLQRAYFEEHPDEKITGLLRDGETIIYNYDEQEALDYIGGGGIIPMKAYYSDHIIELFQLKRNILKNPKRYHDIKIDKTLLSKIKSPEDFLDIDLMNHFEWLYSIPIRLKKRVPELQCAIVYNTLKDENMMLYQGGLYRYNRLRKAISAGKNLSFLIPGIDG